MREIFSVKALINISIVVLSIIGLYLFFLLLPLFKPMWNVLYTVTIPFIISMIIAYLLHPLVDSLMKLRMNRFFAILLIYLLFFCGMTFIGWLGTPIFIEQVKELVSQLPEIQNNMEQRFSTLNTQLELLPDGIHHGIDDGLKNLEAVLRRLMVNILEALGQVLSNIMVLIVVPFLVFYLLNDVEAIQKIIIFLVPRKKRKLIVKLWKDIDQSLGEYIRGQILVSLIVGIGCFIGYTLLGLPYSLFLALIVAVANIIPYFGPYIGAAPAILVAILREPSLIIWVVVINAFMQIIEGNILSPWIVGKRLHIHPIFIIFALLLGAEIGGVVGLILAVPIFVVLKVIVVNTVLHVRAHKIDSTYQE